MGHVLGSIGRAIDPTTGRGLQFWGSSGISEIARKVIPNYDDDNPIDPAHVFTPRKAPETQKFDPGYQPRFDPGAAMPLVGRTPVGGGANGVGQGYGLNPHQQALVDALRRR